MASPRAYELVAVLTRAEPARLPLAIFLMKAGTSMCVGHARVHGASKQKRHRLASKMASASVSGGLISRKFASICSCGKVGCWGVVIGLLI